MRCLPLVHSALSVITALLTLAATAQAATPAQKPTATASPSDTWAQELEAWRQKAEVSLRKDNGWLTLAGRFVMKPGPNTFGTGKDNDIVFPPELIGTGPARLGTLDVGVGGVTLTLEAGVSMTANGTPFSGTRTMNTSSSKRDWVTLGRIAMHVIERNDTSILRLADNESAVRKNFAGRIWYPAKPNMVVDAKYVPYPPGKTIPIVNVIDEVSEEPCPGYVEFKIGNKTFKLDAVGEEAGLFFVFRDATAGITTYRPSRFLYVEKKPAPNTVFKLDFNRAYNPPCAFSEFTTCPLPPKQNILNVKIEAGEQVRKKA